MKEKRYLCDFVFGELDKQTNWMVTLIVILSLLFILAIASPIFYNAYLANYEHELVYPASTYEYLDEIANNVIQEGGSINLSAIPDDVICEINTKNDEIIFKYYLDNNKYVTFASPANITIKLSNNLNIISQKQNYSSEESYVKSVKLSMGLISVMNSFIIFAVFWLIIFTGGVISKERKQKDLMNDIKSEIRKQKIFHKNLGALLPGFYYIGNPMKLLVSQLKVKINC